VKTLRTDMATFKFTQSPSCSLAFCCQLYSTYTLQSPDPKRKREDEDDRLPGQKRSRVAEKNIQMPPHIPFRWDHTGVKQFTKKGYRFVSQGPCLLWWFLALQWKVFLKIFKKNYVFFKLICYWCFQVILIYYIKNN
jgi:hypothetical protein